jgi:hypothetical protein
MDGRGEIAIIFPKMKSSKMLSGTLRNKNNDMEYELKDVFTVREPGHFNDQWHIPISKEMMNAIEAKHKYDIVYELKI